MQEDGLKARVRFHPQLTDLAAQPQQFLALFLHQPALALRALRARVFDPPGQGRCRQIQLAGHGTDGLAFVEDQAYGAVP